MIGPVDHYINVINLCPSPALPNRDSLYHESIFRRALSLIQRCRIAYRTICIDRKNSGLLQ